MRNFEERIAEITRRSEAIQAMRKKRKKQILTVCIPLVLCIAIAIPLILPGLQHKGSPAEEFGVMENIAESKAYPVTAIEVTNLNHSEIITNQTQITNICNLLYSVTEERTESNNVQPDAEVEPSGKDNQVAEDDSYHIVLRAEDGSSSSYHLSGDLLLVDNKTGKTYELTTSQGESLMTLLSRALLLVDNKTGKVYELG